MAELPSVKDKMLEEETDFESPVSEQLLQKIGSNINFIIDLTDAGSVTSYTTPGNFTYNVPTGAAAVAVLIAGGGAGGGAGASGFGGRGCVPFTTVIPVTPGGSVSVTVGSGGTGESSLGASDATGGTESRFGPLTIKGAEIGGSPNVDTFRVLGNMTAPGLSAISGPQPGNDSPFADGGDPGSGGGVGISGGGGGAGYGNGGRGGSTANLPTDGGISAGGGMTGAGATGGGDGGDGIVIVVPILSS